MTMRLPARFSFARLLLAGVLMLCAVAARAQSFVVVDDRPVRFFAGIGLTGGGDRLVTTRYNYRDDYTLHAGGVFQAHFGAEFKVAPGVSLALSAGYHVDGNSNFWGSTTFSRYPIEALAHVRLQPGWRAGGGLRVALNPRLSSDGYAPVTEEDFRTAVGGVVEVEYLFNPWLGLKLRGVFERYESKLNLPTVSGNHVGLVLNFYF